MLIKLSSYLLDCMCTSNAETVVATIEVQDVRASGRMLEFATSCTNEQGELAITGAARALLPRAERPARAH